MRTRMAHLAVAMAIGVWASAWTGVFATAPRVWACGLVVVLLARRIRRGWLLVLLAGATLAAHERRGGPSRDGVDDREADTIVGVVTGPVLASPGRTTLVVDEVLVTTERTDALPGDRVRVTGRLKTPRGLRNPGGVDRAQIVRDRGGDLELTTGEVEIVTRGAAWSAWRWPVRAHRAAIATIAARGGDPAGSAIVRAAVIGDRGAILEGTDQAWRAAGIYHALSVSGLHLAVVALLLYGAVRRAWLAIPALAMRADAARIAAIAAAPAAIAYTMVTGGQTATLRALVVVLVVLGGVVLRRRVFILDALGLAAIAILALRPSALLDPSFQLSFVAAGTMCVIARPRPLEPVGRVRRWIVEGVRASLWITATTAPITAYHFHQLALGGVVGNLVLAPLVELVVIPAGLLGLVLGGPLIDLAIVVASVVDRGAALLARVIPVLDAPPPRPLEVVAWIAALVLLHRGRRRAAAAGAAIVVASLAWSYLAAPPLRTDLRVTFLDVGQGDAAVVELPGGAVWLIDAGGLPITPSPTIDAATAARLQRGPGDAIRRFLDHRRLRRIDVAIVSHPHPDHYLGLLALAGEVPIGELWIARPPPGPAPVGEAGLPQFDRVVDALRAHGTRVVEARLGAARRDHGVTLEVLGPRLDGEPFVAAADPVRSVNDDSLVVALGFAGRRVLFLGDVEQEGEDRLVAAGGARADVVKVAHHGSGTSSTQGLVDAASPAYAVISCGRANRFGFPAPDVVARWAARGATVLRTDLAGAVTVTVTAPGELRVETHD